MTPIAVKEALDSVSEERDFTDNQLSEMFEAVYRRKPDVIDRQAGLLPMIRLLASMITL